VDGEPQEGEDGKSFAKRMLDKQYPGNNETGSDSEYSKIQKWADGSFE
jgi:hypothetical protein